MTERVETVARIGGLRIHRFQVVREHRRRSDENDAGGDGRDEWIVVGFGDEGSDDVGSDDVDGEDAEGAGDERAVVLAAPDFEWTRRVSGDAFEAGRFEPLSAGGVPVWGY